MTSCILSNMFRCILPYLTGLVFFIHWDVFSHGLYIGYSLVCLLFIYFSMSIKLKWWPSDQKYHLLQCRPCLQSSIHFVLCRFFKVDFNTARGTGHRLMVYEDLCRINLLASQSKVRESLRQLDYIATTLAESKFWC